METVKEKGKTEKGVSVTHGYARCSTTEDRQDIQRQVRELKVAGATCIWMEYEHGDSASKEQQELMFDAVKPGDTIIVTEPSRLSRSTQQFCRIIDLISQKSLRLQVLGSITIDCRTSSPDPMTIAFLQMVAVFSEFELSMIRERVRSGIANARAKGKRIGRPPISADNIPDSFFRYYSRFQEGKLNISELARLTQLSRPTVYRYIAVIAGNGK